MPVTLTPLPTVPTPGTSTRKFNIANRIGGVLVDLDSIPVFRDPTLSYGIKENSSGAVVLVAGTPFVRQDVGLYTYEVTGLAAGLSYTAYIETVYLGQTGRDPIIWTAGTLQATGLYANEDDLDDLRGSDNITAWSDLNDDNARNHSRIQRAFDSTDAGIQKCLERVYDFPLTLSTVDAQILNTWSSVLTSYMLYTSRGVSSNTTTGRQINPYKTEMQEILDDMWLYQNNKRTLHNSKRSGSSTRVTTGTILVTGTALDRRNHWGDIWTDLFSYRW